MLSWHASFIRWPRGHRGCKRMAGAYCVNRRLRMPLSTISGLVEFVGPAFEQNIALVLGERHFAMSKLCQSIEMLPCFCFFLQMQQTIIEHLVNLREPSPNLSPRHLERLSLSPRFLGRLAGNWPKSGCGPHMLQPQRHWCFHDLSANLLTERKLNWYGRRVAANFWLIWPFVCAAFRQYKCIYIHIFYLIYIYIIYHLYIYIQWSASRTTHGRNLGLFPP